MKSPDFETRRPRAFEEPIIWDSSRAPRMWEKDGMQELHPAHRCAIFTVHGIGQQHWAETAAGLRAGFEDALEEIYKWQEGENAKAAKGESARKDATLRTAALPYDLNQIKKLPSPYIYEGYWADYADLKATFPTECRDMSDKERDFFEQLWGKRPVSSSRTLIWFLRRQFSLLHPRNIPKVGAAYLLYIPLQIVATVTLFFAWLRRPAIIKGFLADVRLYCDPQGEIEKAIVQRIDRRVGSEFLKMLNLDWEFRELPWPERISRSGKLVDFNRIIWVAHSLGTVISYNVLSDLFLHAKNIKVNGDDEQIRGVDRLHDSLRRFVTLGSPLDKIAFLFGRKTLRPWPKEQRNGSDDEWWINFYHVLDPVSGVLSSDLISHNDPPANFHIRSCWIPGLAHLAYWKDSRSLRFILGRTYGAENLPDKDFNPWPDWKKNFLAILAYFVWLGFLLGITAGFFFVVEMLIRTIF
ncbi:MAG: hypothetical protein KJ970_17575 [Candidatus Eisenbacteria bacterium]|uniref:Uncharacterized protein n=1 Tax=Eiseniibacteriota bacterium TaxID=2212470 RepID=A0A948RXM3_UNCEI|nr:hypothetical protein [Candidatus Eisenbacteria bacterium]MBU2692730.1 hypothetical protein [Candidatus Eisenbacteria bacterium]